MAYMEGHKLTDDIASSTVVSAVKFADFIINDFHSDVNAVSYAGEAFIPELFQDMVITFKE